MSKPHPKSKEQTVRVDLVNFSNGSFQTFSEEIGRRPPQYSARVPKTSTSDFAYVNTAYVGSTHSLNENRHQQHQPPVSVIREQYWACSKWGFATRVLVIAVSVLVGAVIGLSILVATKGDTPTVSNIFKNHPAPD